MAQIVEFTLPTDAFPLGEAVDAEPDLLIELERIVPTTHDVMPFFWVWNSGDFDAFARTVRRSAAVKSLAELAAVDSGRLYQASWNKEVEGVLQGVIRSNATILDARGSHDGWTFELRFPATDDLQAFQGYIVDHDISFELTRVKTLTEILAGDRYNLTKQQRDLIITAYKMGYFNEPQGTTQSEIAAQLGISQRAVSRRLHRGLRQLITTTIGGE